MATRTATDIGRRWLRLAGWVMGPAALVLIAEVLLDRGAACPPGSEACGAYGTLAFWLSVLIPLAAALAGLWALVRWARGGWWIAGVYILAGIPVLGGVNGLMGGGVRDLLASPDVTVGFMLGWPITVALYFMGQLGG